MPSPSLPAAVQALAQAIRQATDADSEELARNLLATDDQHLFGANEFKIRDLAHQGGKKDGITDWERHPANPIVRPGKGRWDADAVYKPYAVFDGKRWLLWYNGRRGGVEQIGAAIHDGEDLGF